MRGQRDDVSFKCKICKLLEKSLNRDFEHETGATNDVEIELIKLLFNFSDPPSVTLQLGPSLNPDDIEEGDDCYFECIIKANPPTYKVVWRHNVS